MKTMIYCYLLVALPFFGHSQNITKADWIVKTDLLAPIRGNQAISFSFEKKILTNQSLELGMDYVFEYLFKMPIGAHPVVHHLNLKELNFNANLGWKHYFINPYQQNTATFLYHQFQYQSLHFQHYDTSCERVLTSNLFMNTLFANGDCTPNSYQTQVFKTNNQRWSIFSGIGKIYRSQQWTFEGIIALAYYRTRVVYPKLTQALAITPSIQERIDNRIIDGSSVYSSYFTHGDPLDENLQNGFGLQLQLKVGYILE